MTSLKIALSGEEISVLKEYRNQGYLTIERKASAILLMNSGVDVEVIADFVDRKPSTIHTWVRDFNQLRLASIFSFHLGNTNASKLTCDQRERVFAVLSKPPSQEGIDARFWTVPQVRDWIASELDVVYESDTSIHMLLKHAGLRFKLPGSVDKRRADPSTITQRMAAIREEITDAMADDNHMVFAADEVRVESETELRRAWIHHTDPGVIRVDRNRKAQSYCGFLNNKTGTVDLFAMDWQNTTNIISVLDQLTHRYPHTRITIVWDNARWHRAKALRELLGQGQQFEHIHLVWMPPYAPDHNPIERVWNEAKTAIANKQRTCFTDTLQAFENFIHQTTFTHKI